MSALAVIRARQTEGKESTGDAAYSQGLAKCLGQLCLKSFPGEMDAGVCVWLASVRRQPATKMKLVSRAAGSATMTVRGMRVMEENEDVSQPAYFR